MRIMAMLVLTLQGLGPSPVEPVAPVWMSETQESVWRAAQRHGLSAEHAQRVLEEIWDSREPIHCPDVDGYWREQGVDPVPVLIRIYGELDLPNTAPGYLNRDASRSDILRYMTRFRDPRANDFLVETAEEALRHPVRCSEDESFLLGLFVSLGLTKYDKALDVLFKVQSKEFWESEDAPIVDRDVTSYKAVTPQDIHSAIVKSIRTYAIMGIRGSGTERAIHAFGTGEGIAEDFAGSLDENFRMTVFYHVGFFGSMERPVRARGLLRDRVNRAKEIYRKYGKRYKG